MSHNIIPGATLTGITPKERNNFWAKVDTSAGINGCWTWTGAMCPRGYGKFGVGGRTQSAHRVSFAVRYGGITEAKPVICHSCDNPKCVNPNHLFAGTHRDNMRDMREKGRAPHGVLTNTSILDDDAVRKIRSEYATGNVSQMALAKRYGVTDGCICNCIARKTWRHV